MFKDLLNRFLGRTPAQKPTGHWTQNPCQGSRTRLIYIRNKKTGTCRVCRTSGLRITGSGVSYLHANLGERSEPYRHA